jgi:hypothetical protein
MLANGRCVALIESFSQSRFRGFVIALKTCGYSNSEFVQLIESTAIVGHSKHGQVFERDGGREFARRLAKDRAPSP